MGTNPSDHITNNSNNSNNMNATKLLESGKYSDLIISCHGREFKVHKAIICPQSEVITKLCDMDTEVKRTGTIQHEDFDDDTMERMIDFVYKRKYDVTRRPKELASQDVAGVLADLDRVSLEDFPLSEDDEDSVDPAIEKEENPELSTVDIWVIHARVYSLADFYDMSDLRDYAQHCFEQVADSEPEDMNMDGFINVAREISKKTTRESGLVTREDPLRTEFLSLVARYASKLAADGGFITALCDPELQDIATVIFRVLGQRMIELETKIKEMNSSFQAEKMSLQQSLSTAKETADAQISIVQLGREVVEERCERAEGAIQNLIRSLKNLPTACLNSSCTNEFGDLKFEKKGNGEWQVRCGRKKCKCKLN